MHGLRKREPTIGAVSGQIDSVARSGVSGWQHGVRVIIVAKQECNDGAIEIHVE